MNSISPQREESGHGNWTILHLGTFGSFGVQISFIWVSLICKLILWPLASWPPGLCPHAGPMALSHSVACRRHMHSVEPGSQRHTSTGQRGSRGRGAKAQAVRVLSVQEQGLLGAKRLWAGNPQKQCQAKSGSSLQQMQYYGSPVEVAVGQ